MTAREAINGSVNAYLVAVLGVFFISGSLVVALEVARPEGYNSQALYTILGMGGTILATLLGIIKAIGTANKAAEKAEEAADRIDVNTGLTVSAVATTTAVAERMGVDKDCLELAKDTLEKSLPKPDSKKRP